VTPTDGAVVSTVTGRAVAGDGVPVPSTDLMLTVCDPSASDAAGLYVQVAAAVPQPVQTTPLVEAAAPSMETSTRLTTPSLSAAAPDQFGRPVVTTALEAGPPVTVSDGAALPATMETCPVVVRLPAGSLSDPAT